MPDLINYAVTRIAPATLTVPRWQVDGQIVDSSDHTIVVADISAANVIFPNVLGNLSNAKQDEWVATIMQNLIFRRFGLA